MATWLGNQGTVTAGGSVVGELKSWTLNRSVGIAETTSRGDSWRTRTAGLKDASGTIACHFDKADAQQDALVVGATVALALEFDDGTDTFSGNAIITGENFSADINDQVTEAEYTWVNADNTGITQEA